MMKFKKKKVIRKRKDQMKTKESSKLREIKERIEETEKRIKRLILILINFD